MVSRVLSVLVALIVLSGPARADNYKVSSLSSGNWSGGAYRDKKTDKFSYCGMYASYKSGISVHFAIDRDEEWRIGFNSTQFNFREGNQYTVAYSIDNSRPTVLTGTARSSTFVLIDLPSNSALFDHFRGGTMLSVGVSGRVYQFRLDGTSRALAVLLECARQYDSKSLEARNTTAAPALAPPAPSTKRGITANDRLDATRFVANLFARGTFQDYRFMTSDELADKKWPELLRSADVAWIAPQAVGLLHIFSTDDISIDDQLSAALASDAKSCQGRFASGKFNDDEETNFKRLFTVCDDKEKSFNVEYLFLPRKNGLAYRFATMIFGRADQAPDNKDLREALKKARFVP
jgi:hypothetical protein